MPTCPGFPHAGVSGHQPKLVIGDLEGVRVAVLGGRAHYYERGDPAAMRRPLETLRALGAERLILTNAAGSFRPDMPPGELMLLADHINFSGRNPLIGEATDARFVNMTDAYDPALRGALRDAAAAEGVRARAKASTPGTPARASRPRPRSARSASSAPTRSACRRCPR